MTHPSLWESPQACSRAKACKIWCEKAKSLEARWALRNKLHPLKLRQKLYIDIRIVLITRHFKLENKMIFFVETGYKVSRCRILAESSLERFHLGEKVASVLHEMWLCKCSTHRNRMRVYNLTAFENPLVRLYHSIPAKQLHINFFHKRTWYEKVDSTAIFLWHLRANWILNIPQFYTKRMVDVWPRQSGTLLLQVFLESAEMN